MVRGQGIYIAVCFVILLPAVYGWGIDGHFIVCAIAESRLSSTAAAAVSDLLGGSEAQLADYCSWADQVRFRYHWSSPLHYINTPDSLCTYDYNRDCKDKYGVRGRCVAGAINNYTSQLLRYGSSSSSSCGCPASIYNNFITVKKKESLNVINSNVLYVKPLHVGFASDEGGNTIDVTWYRRKDVLHHVWDGDIIETEEKRFYDLTVSEMIDALQTNITKEWADLVNGWESCSRTEGPPCTDTYATESIQAACDWAYKDASEGSVLTDPYFQTRRPVVNIRLAQAGVRLAATLNRLFSHFHLNK